MILYGNSLSPFVRKVLAYASEKGIALELRPGGMGQGEADFREASPLGKMPAFRDPGADGGRDFTISDSSAIIAYLEAKYPAPVMIPADPIGRARVTWFEEFGDTIVAKAGGAMFFNRFVAPRILQRAGDDALADAAERTDLPVLLDYLEGVVPASGFLVGDVLTLADIAVASPFANIAHVGVSIDAARWPRARAYVDAILARPSFAETIARERAFVAKVMA